MVLKDEPGQVWANARGLFAEKGSEICWPGNMVLLLKDVKERGEGSWVIYDREDKRFHKE